MHITQVFATQIDLSGLSLSFKTFCQIELGLFNHWRFTITFFFWDTCWFRLNDLPSIRWKSIVFIRFLNYTICIFTLSFVHSCQLDIVFTIFWHLLNFIRRFHYASVNQFFHLLIQSFWTIVLLILFFFNIFLILRLMILILKFMNRLV